MLYQTDDRLRLEVRDDECYVFVVLDIFEDFTKHTFEPKDIERIHKLAVRIGAIRKDGYIEAKGIRGLSQVASAVVGKPCYLRLITDDGPWNAVAAKYVRWENGRELSHFVRMNLDKTKVTYDPYPNSKTVREGTLSGFRHIYAEAL